MKISSNLKVNAVCALLITSVIIPNVSRAAVITTPIPLTISGVTYEQFGPRPGCPAQFGGTTTGVGISSLLGKVSFEANDCVIPQNDSLLFSGKMVFTLLGGDEILADYSGSFIPTSYPSIFTMANALFAIKGGTGDFLNATGGGTLQGSEKISSNGTGVGLMQATGTISNFKNSKNYSVPKVAYQSITGVVDEVTGITPLSSGLMSGSTTTLSDYFYQEQNGRIQAVNTLPESSSWSLIGIGLAGLAVMRRRKLIIGNLEKTG
jgi:hypothetical protein